MNQEIVFWGKFHLIWDRKTWISMGNARVRGGGVRRIQTRPIYTQTQTKTWQGLFACAMCFSWREDCKSFTHWRCSLKHLCLLFLLLSLLVLTLTHWQCAVESRKIWEPPLVPTSLAASSPTHWPLRPENDTHDEVGYNRSPQMNFQK